GFNYMTDIDLSVDGKIVVGSWFGNVFLTDESLDQFSRFFIGEERTLFFAFTKPVPEPASGSLLLLGLIGWKALFSRKRRSGA
ncbi:MAG: PEP-CTERM sorting domain-containing protein, partial [Armatimonadota bacterium]